MPSSRASSACAARGAASGAGAATAAASLGVGLAFNLPRLPDGLKKSPKCSSRTSRFAKLSTRLTPSSLEASPSPASPECASSGKEKSSPDAPSENSGCELHVSSPADVEGVTMPSSRGCLHGRLPAVWSLTACAEVASATTASWWAVASALVHLPWPGSSCKAANVAATLGEPCCWHSTEKRLSNTRVNFNADKAFTSEPHAPPPRTRAEIVPPALAEASRRKPSTCKAEKVEWSARHWARRKRLHTTGAAARHFARALRDGHIEVPGASGVMTSPVLGFLMASALLIACGFFAEASAWKKPLPFGER
mmetsp:Transcript_67672/g.207322  ORF Transcript_67672/g.207322 Transcript_67672/m.207322 type:complete len:309 (-) Transcript_67672:108-1034(-)